MTEKPLESRVYVYCKVVDPKDEESFVEIEPYGAGKKSHRAKTLIPRAGFYASLNPFDLLECVQGAFVTPADKEQVMAELDRFDRLVLDTPPIFCEFPESDWIAPEGTHEVVLSEHARSAPYWFLMSGVTRHMVDMGNHIRQAADKSLALRQVRATQGYQCFGRLLGRELEELGKERNAHALYLGLEVVLNDGRLTERALSRYIGLLHAMNDKQHTAFYVAKREFLKELRKSALS